jgi:hypothetical protein
MKATSKKTFTGGNMNKRILKLGMAAGIVAAFGCAQKKTNTASKQKYTSSFAMSGSSSPTTVVQNSIFEQFYKLFVPNATANIPTSMTDSQGTTVTFSSAWIVIKEVEFKAAESTTTESEDETTEGTEFKGPYFVNLTNATAQVLDTKSLTAKTYRRIKMGLEAAEDNTSAGWPSDAPIGLQNNSMYIDGLYNNTAFSFSSHDGAEFTISGTNGITPEEGQNLLVSIKFSDIIKKTNLAALTTASNKNISETNRIAVASPCPSIDTSAEDLYTCFRKGLEGEADFGKDSDGSGELEVDEEGVK